MHFFLLCNNANSLLETIRSRAPILRTEPIERDAMAEYICSHDRRAAQMKLSSPKEFEEIITTASGGIGKALELLEPKVWKPIHELRELVNDFLSSSVSQASARDVLPLLSRFSSKRDVLERELMTLSEGLRDLILLKKSDDVDSYFYALGGGDTWPMTVVLDSEGIVTARFDGSVDYETLKAAIEDALG